MRILLVAINAKYIHSNLAIYSLKGAAGALASHVELAEFTINHRVEEILRDIYQKKPEVLLFSCYIWNIEYVKELVTECGKVMPGVPVWLGGPEVSYDAEKMLEAHPELTGILTGEGEESFCLLLECYVNNQDGNYNFSRVPGAVYRFKAKSEELKKIQFNEKELLPEINQIPFPYKDLADFQHRIIYYESSRGCPFSCSYCLSSIDRHVRFRDLALVKQEIQFFLDQRVSQVKFVDRTFNGRRSHALAIWNYLLEHDNGVTNFHFEIAADLLGEEELNVIQKMRPGLIQLEIGVQSTNPETIQAINRKMDLKKLKENVAKIHKMGNVHQHLDLIAGLPFEDYTSFARSFDEVFAMKPEQLQLGFLKVLKGTNIYREAKNYGIVFRDKAPYEILYSSWLSFSDILKLKAIEEMVEIYYNSVQFRNTLEKLLENFSSAFHLFEELAAFYDRKGLTGRNHSRIQRYEILLDFICERLPEEERLYRELLTIDIYLRERMKSRPPFATDQSDFRQKIQEIQRQTGKQTHVEVLRVGKEEPVYLIFDYSKRNPLTNDAYVSQWRHGSINKK